MASRGRQTLWEWVESILRGAPERGLTEGERALVPPELAEAINLGAVRIRDRAHNPFALGKLLVRGDVIHWHGAPADVSQAQPAMQALLMHELAHVWQYRTGRLSAWRYLTEPANWRYHYLPNTDLRLDDYAVEEQADIIEDWFRQRQGYPLANWRERPPPAGWLETVVVASLRLRSLRG